MPIQLRTNDQFGTGLIATCDVCGKKCHDWKTNVCWHTYELKPGQVHKFKLACKGECTDKVEAEIGDLKTLELGTMLMYLLHNCEVDYEKVLERAAFISML